MYAEPPPSEGDISTDEEPDNDLPPLQRVVRRARFEREDWSSEDDITLAELKKRLRHYETTNKTKKNVLNINCYDSSDEHSEDEPRRNNKKTNDYNDLITLLTLVDRLRN